MNQDVGHLDQGIGLNPRGANPLDQRGGHHPPHVVSGRPIAQTRIAKPHDEAGLDYRFRHPTGCLSTRGDCPRAQLFLVFALGRLGGVGRRGRCRIAGSCCRRFCSRFLLLSLRALAEGDDRGHGLHRGEPNLDTLANL